MKQQYVEKVKSMTGEQFMDTLNEAKTLNGETALLMARGADRIFTLDDVVFSPRDEWGAFNPDDTMGWKRCQPPYDKYFASYDGKIKGPQGGELTQLVNNAGYAMVSVVVDGKQTTSTVHRLTCSAWVPNDDPENKRVVDHKDDDKLNNVASNLQWLTYSQNLTKSHRMAQMTTKKGKQMGMGVVKVDEDGTRTTYKSASAAGKANGLSPVSVTGNAKGQLKLDRTYHFELSEH